MKAARFHARGDIRIEDIPEPTVAPGTVGIDVAWCGICGTDLHEFMEGPIFIPPCGHPHPISGESAPVTMGHEFSGVVYAVGEGVTDIQVGQHVVVEPYIIADDVPTGPGERYHLSKNMNFIGLGGRGGGLSEKIAVKRRWVHPISNAIPLDQAALIEPLSVGHHAYVRSGAKAGDAEMAALAQDELAAASHHNLARAWKDGFFDDLVTPYLGQTIDQTLRADTSVEKLAKLRPVFGDEPGASMTAGNSTPLSDGAAVVLFERDIARFRDPGVKFNGSLTVGSFGRRLMGLGLTQEQVVRKFSSINNAAPAFSDAAKLFCSEPWMEE